jgi:hypothetical protein
MFGFPKLGREKLRLYVVGKKLAEGIVLGQAINLYERQREGRGTGLVEILSSPAAAAPRPCRFQLDFVCSDALRSRIGRWLRRANGSASWCQSLQLCEPGFGAARLEIVV